MFKEKKGKEVDVMSTMKPIQATPELSGEDAIRLINQVNIAPTKKAIKRNKMLRSILRDISK